MTIRLLITLLLSYLAVAASFAGAPIGAASAHLPTLVILLAVRWLPPSLASLSAFGIGLAVDALAAGPLGLHAATLVIVTAILLRCGITADDTPVSRTMIAILLTSWCAAAVDPLADWFLHRNDSQLLEALLSHTATAAIVAAAVGFGVIAWKQVSPRSRHVEC